MTSYLTNRERTTYRLRMVQTPVSPDFLARKEAIVSRGVAIEELAGVGHAVRRQDRHPDPEQGRGRKAVQDDQACATAQSWVPIRRITIKAAT
jgi:hypothetical protein